jgi:hypothetical protein
VKAQSDTDPEPLMPQIPDRHSLTDERDPLSVCPDCHSSLVRPLEGLPASDGSPELLLLHCPECESVRRALATPEQVDELEEHLALCVADMLSDLSWLEDAAMEDWVTRFGGALAADQILPEDF